MEVILLEKITKLGAPGDLVNVRSGFARNFLIPTGKAIKANEQNKTEYEQRKASLEAAELERKEVAEKLAKKINSLEISIPVAVSEEGTLYGSIGTREISEAINLQGIEIEKGAIRLPEGTLKDLGEYVDTTYGGHYTSNDNNVQTLDIIESVGDAKSFCRSNAIKYLTRYEKKGQAKRDILKAAHYCLLLYYFDGHTNTN